ncbi:MAG: BON domain-containing protein [Acidobacteriia bacterium]|nr:BON domain-containing protein [Terriglobia bacterium]
MLRAKSWLLLLAVVTICFPASAQTSAQKRGPSQKATERIQKAVRHELLMLPWFGVFDNLAFKVDGYDVTLLGQVTQPSLKADAEAAVKKVEGVEKVDNKIEVLPASSSDDRLRRRLYRAIYGYDILKRYELDPDKPIRIIVKSGHVTLEGYVDNQADKIIAGSRARGVSGTYSVTNNLAVPK